MRFNNLALAKKELKRLGIPVTIDELRKLGFSGELKKRRDAKNFVRQKLGLPVIQRKSTSVKSEVIAALEKKNVIKAGEKVTSKRLIEILWKRSK